MWAGITLIVAILLLGLGATAETRYELIEGSVTYGNDLIITGLTNSLIHQQEVAGLDEENLGVSFPAALPFSPSVCMALPSISQEHSASMSASSLGYFESNIPFYPCCNFGAAPVGVGQSGKPSPVSPAPFKGRALMYPEMINMGILSQNLSYENTNINSTMVTLPPALAIGPYSEVAAIASETRGETPINNSTINKPPMLLSTHRLNFDSNATEISNMSIVERMWRNSHVAHLMDIAYEGDASRPIWMEPLKPTEALQRTSHARVLDYAMNMTRPGAYLTRSFWDL